MIVSAKVPLLYALIDRVWHKTATRSTCSDSSPFTTTEILYMDGHTPPTCKPRHSPALAITASLLAAPAAMASPVPPLDAGALAFSHNSTLLQRMDAQPGSTEPVSAPAAVDASELAKKLSNPISDLISVPFQFNYDEGYGPKNVDRNTLNIQPVIPFSISDDWNLISRTIVPLIYQGSPAEGVDSKFALGDVTQSLFFSPKEPIGGWIVGWGRPFCCQPARHHRSAARTSGSARRSSRSASRMDGRWARSQTTSGAWRAATIGTKSTRHSSNLPRVLMANSNHPHAQHRDALRLERRAMDRPGQHPAQPGLQDRQSASLAPGGLSVVRRVGPGRARLGHSLRRDTHVPPLVHQTHSTSKSTDTRAPT